jgi:hypothetical protein
MVFPVTIGGGLRVFPESTQRWSWDLAGSTPYEGGIRLDVYTRA